MEGGAAPTLFLWIDGKAKSGVAGCVEPYAFSRMALRAKHRGAVRVRKNDENLYARGDRVSVVCEATTALLAHNCQGNGLEERLGDTPYHRGAVLGLSATHGRRV